jgi:RNAse (barnase) inhibitor barstar
MSAFTNDPSEWQRLDWSLLQNSPIALYHSTGVLEEDIEWFKQDGYDVRSLDSERWESATSLLLALGTTLRFPEHFGRTLDAFNDCVSDLDVPQDGGFVLVLREFERVAASFPIEAHAILDILASNSRRFLLTGQRLIVLVHSNDPEIQFQPVGATPVLWNPREWLDAKRVP